MTDMRAPRNTSDDGEEILLHAMITGSPSGGIEAQEARGQRSFVASDTLPSEGLYAFARLGVGIEVLGEVTGDPIFSYVKLPQGWTKRGGDHAMWSYLLDEKGRERAAIFYKAAFYDRSAHISPSTRFKATRDFDLQERTGERVGLVKDGETVVFRTAPRKVADAERDWVEGEQAIEEARAWLAERFPDWRNPAAYWDEPALAVASETTP